MRTGKHRAVWMTAVLAVFTAGTAIGANRAPVARAGPDLVVQSGSFVQLDGTGSADPDGGTIPSYAWAQTGGPVVGISGQFQAAATVSPVTTGTYVFRLTVDDGLGGSSQDTSEVVVQAAPIGADIAMRSVTFSPAATATNHTFSGRATLQNTGNRAVSTAFTVGFFLSTDPALAPASLNFVGSSAPIAALGVAQTVGVVENGLSVGSFIQPNAYFLGAQADNGFTVAELSETNNQAASALQLAVSANAAPVATFAVAGTPPFIVTDRQPIRILLDGRGSSDADRDTLLYSWSKTAGPSVTLVSPSSATTEILPDQGGNYIFSLNVDDGHGGQNRVNLAVPVVSNASPVISAPAFQLLTSTDAATVSVRLDATGTRDPDGDPMTFQWVQTSVPPIALVNASSALATFSTARTTTFNFSLTVRDNRGGRSTFASVVTIVLNLSPTASTGPSRIATVTDSQPITITFDGRGSTDPDGDPLDYSWQQTAGPAATLVSPTSPTPSFTTATAASYTFRLTVADRRGGFSSRDITITVQSNRSPTARTGAAQSIAAVQGRTVVVTLDGSSSTDPDSDPLTYSWQQLSGPAVQLFDPAAPKPAFSAGAPGTFQFRLTVSDRRGGTSVATASATVSFPDLKPVGATFPTTAGAGSAFAGTVTVTNSSAVQLAAPFDAAVFLSSDQTLDGADPRIATVRFTGLDAGKSATAVFTAPLALDFPAGSYSVLVKVDPAHAITQPSRADDLFVAPQSLRVLSPPDLILTGVLGPASAKVGLKAGVSGTVLNQGGQALAVPFRAAIFLCEGAAIDAKAIRISTVQFGPIGSAASVSFTTEARVPPGTAPGAYKFGVRIDPEGALAANELVRANNDGFAASSTAILPLPDLEVVTIETDSPIPPAEPFPLRLQIKNKGGASADKPFTYWYLLSKDATRTPTGVFLGALVRSLPIGAGKTVAVTDTRTLPGAMAPGSYFAKAVLDPQNELEEEDNENNVGVSAAAVTLEGRANLVLSAASAGPTVDVRRVLAIPVSVDNLGNTTSAVFEVRVSRSANRIFDLDDRLLGKIAGPGLRTAARSSLTVTAALDPLQTALGAGFLLVHLISADAASQDREGPPGNLKAFAVTFVDPARPPAVALSYSRASPVAAGSLTITATSDIALVTPPSITLDQPGTVDLLSSRMSGGPTTFTFVYAVSPDNGGAFRDGEAIVTVAGGKDANGNLNQPASNGRFRIDTRAPVVTAQSPADGGVSRAAGTLAGRVTDESTLAALSLSVNGGLSTPFTPGSTGAFRVPYTLTGDANDLVVTAADSAGNRSTTSIRLARDTDGDGLPDAFERSNGFNPSDGADGAIDSDRDGLTNLQEFGTGTDPRNPDSDGDGASDGVEVARGTNPRGRDNPVPVADAGRDKIQGPGLVVLDGSRSRSLDGGLVTYAWAQTEGAAVTLTGDALPNPQFSARTAGRYGFRVTVRSLAGATATANVRIDVANAPPVASAGTEQTGALGRRVLLDGSLSSDANGDPLTYDWTERTGNPQLGVLGNPRIAQPEFVPPKPGAYVFSLGVNDGSQPSAAVSTVRVLVLDAAQRIVAPNADAGPDQTVTAGSVVTLDGHESADADSAGKTLTYRWRAVSTPPNSPPALLANGATSTPSFTASSPGLYRFELVVIDSADDGLTSAPDWTDVVVNASGNRVPRADAGSDRTARVGEIVMFDGSASADTDRDTLRYAWSQLAGPALALPSTTGAILPVSAVVAGDYLFGLVVSDGQAASPAARARLRVSPDGKNRPPSAVARVNGQNSSTGEVRVRIPDATALTVPLDGGGSSDPDGDRITYRWRQVAGPVAELADGYAALTTFSPKLSRVYAFVLEVSDGIFRTEARVEAVVDSSSNSVPRAAIRGTDRGPVTTVAGATVSLDGGQSADAEGAPLLFRWEQLTGPFLDLIGQGTSRLSVTPRVNGSYTFRLFVDDGADRSVGQDQTIVVANPTPAAGGGTTPTGGTGTVPAATGSTPAATDGGGASCALARSGDGAGAWLEWLLIAGVLGLARRRGRVEGRESRVGDSVPDRSVRE